MEWVYSKPARRSIIQFAPQIPGEVLKYCPEIRVKIEGTNRNLIIPDKDSVTFNRFCEDINPFNLKKKDLDFELESTHKELFSHLNPTPGYSPRGDGSIVLNNKSPIQQIANNVYSGNAITNIQVLLGGSVEDPIKQEMALEDACNFLSIPREVFKGCSDVLFNNKIFSYLSEFERIQKRA